MEERGMRRERHGTWDGGDLADGSRLTGDESSHDLFPSRVVKAEGGGSREGRERQIQRRSDANNAVREKCLDGE